MGVHQRRDVLVIRVEITNYDAWDSGANGIEDAWDSGAWERYGLEYTQYSYTDSQRVREGSYTISVCCVPAIAALVVFHTANLPQDQNCTEMSHIQLYHLCPVLSEK